MNILLVSHADDDILLSRSARISWLAGLCEGLGHLGHTVTVASRIDEGLRQYLRVHEFYSARFAHDFCLQNSVSVISTTALNDDCMKDFDLVWTRDTELAVRTKRVGVPAIFEYHFEAHQVPERVKNESDAFRVTIAPLDGGWHVSHSAVSSALVRPLADESKDGGEFHFVYVGGVGPERLPIRVMREVADSQCPIHIFGSHNRFLKAMELGVGDAIASSRIQFFPRVSHRVLLDTVSSTGVGLYLRSGVEGRIVKSSPLKTLLYAALGLPIVANVHEEAIHHAGISMTPLFSTGAKDIRAAFFDAQCTSYEALVANQDVARENSWQQRASNILELALH